MSSKVNKTLIAIDGGATSSKGGLFINEKLIKKTNEGPINYNLHKKQTLKNLYKIINTLNSKNVAKCSLVLGISGIDTSFEKQSAIKLYTSFVKKFFPNIAKVTILNDAELLYGFSNCENTICMVAGTGTNCIGKSKNASVKVGGLGQVLSDQGGGYVIGLQAIKKAVKSYDGRGQKTILEKEIKEHFKIDSILDLKSIIDPTKTPKKVYAQLVPLVVKCGYQKNDLVAKKIIKNSAKQITIHITTAIKKLNIKNKSFCVVLSGSIFKIPYVLEYVKKEVAKYKKGSVVIKKQPAFYGALKIKL